MILHMATFRWNDGVTDDDIAAVTAALNALPSKIAELRSYIAAPNLHTRPGGADFGVVAVVDDAASLDDYLDHPAHQDVYDRFLGRMIAERSAAQLPLAEGSLA